MSFEVFIAPYYDTCSIEAYDLAKKAWDAQQANINLIIAFYAKDLPDNMVEESNVVNFPRTRLDFGPV